MDRKGLNSIIKGGALPSVNTTTTNNVVDTTSTRQYDTFEDADSPAGVKTISIGGGTFDLNALMNSPEMQEMMRKKKEEEEGSVSDFMKIVDGFGSQGRFSDMMSNIFE